MKEVRPIRRGFTLVELLVVIGIIALLVSILLPALNKARRAATDMQCLSNLRQLGQASMIYAHDWKGVLPTTGGTGVSGDRSYYWISNTDWYEKLPLWKAYGTGFGGGRTYGSNTQTPHIVTAYMCPLARSFITDRSGGKRYTQDYSLNSRLGGEGIGNRAPKVPKLQHLNSKRWWIADGYFAFNSSANYRFYPYQGMPVEKTVGSRFEGPWMWEGFAGIPWSDGLPSHGNSKTIDSRAANFLFGDGHASPVTIGEARAIAATKSGGKSEPLFDWSGNYDFRP